LRQGLTEETVIDGLEDTDDYQAFEQAIIADYDARTAVERELVLRLASCLWRIRRAPGIEPDLFRIQAETLRERPLTSPQTRRVDSLASRPASPSVRAANLPYVGRRGSADIDRTTDVSARRTGMDDLNDISTAPEAPARALSHCFLQLVKLDKGAFQRLNRYETALWRQAAQTMLVLRNIMHR